MRAMLTAKLCPLHQELHFEQVDAGHPARNEVEAFIAQVYRSRYGADLRSFLPHLLAFRDDAGELQAAVGLRYGAEGALFVEQYLDLPAEAAIGARLRLPVARRDLVEVGNFASRSPGDARTIVVRLADLLHGQGIRWVLFAATRQLRNALNKLHLNPQVLAPACPDRLHADAQQWGRYYDAQPDVLWGDIVAAHAHLYPNTRAADSTFQTKLKVCGRLA
jgi:hypothetical protein